MSNKENNKNERVDDEIKNSNQEDENKDKRVLEPKNTKHISNIWYVQEKTNNQKNKYRDGYKKKRRSKKIKREIIQDNKRPRDPSGPATSEIIRWVGDKWAAMIFILFDFHLSQFTYGWHISSPV